MLIFPRQPQFSEYYNRKVHDFIATEFFDPWRQGQTEYHKDSYNLSDELVPFFNDAPILREDLKKCEKVALDLYYWSDDTFGHALDPLHLFALYHFLHRMELWAEEDEYIREVYFHNSAEVAQIDQLWRSLESEQRAAFPTRTALAKYLHDLYNLVEDCFEDIDFITFPELISHAIASGRPVPSALVDEYVELLPRDNLALYSHTRLRSSDLYAEVEAAISEIDHNLQYSSEYKLLWASEKPVDEVGVHDYLLALLKRHFRKTAVQIGHEVDTGSGRIDFCLRREPLEKVLLEIKLAKDSHLCHGLTHQLAHYLKAEKCDEAYYLIFCFTPAELKRAQQFCRNLPSDPESKVKIQILDATQKSPPSRSG